MHRDMRIGRQRWHRTTRVIGGAIVSVVLATAAVGWSPSYAQAPPSELPDGALSGIIVPVENDPANPRPVPSTPKVQSTSDAPVSVAASPDAARQPAPPAQLTPDPTLQTQVRVKAVPPSDVRSASFQGLVPGVATRQHALDKLGEPIGTKGADASQTLTFKVGPFPTVDITFDGDVVASILAHLAAPGARADVLRELKLTSFRSAPIADNEGQQLGEVYPERALTLVYAPSADDATAVTVSDVVLERIAAEPFLLRARADAPLRCGAALSDLEMVHQLAPTNASAYFVESTIHANCGRLSAAMAALREALKNAPESAKYEIALAELQRRASHFDVAKQIVRKVLDRDELTKSEEANAHLVLGKILATMPAHEYKDAMDEIVSGVKTLSSLSKQIKTGPAADEVQQQLIDAQLWLARTITYGPWEKSVEVAPQWLASAEKTARSYIAQQPNAKICLLRVYHASLECLDILEGEGTPDKLADAAIELGRELIAATDDTDAQAWFESELGSAVRHAAEVAYRHGNADDALRLVSNAHALLTSSSKHRPDSMTTTYELAQTAFLTGSIYAMAKSDHASAETWYDEALATLKKTSPPSLRDDRGRTGDQLVSIGVTLWQQGREDEAIRTTELGADRLRQVVESGMRSKRALVIPLANLADMHKALGHADKAKELAEMAASLSRPKVHRTIR